jgi:hypothetical protein
MPKVTVSRARMMDGTLPPVCIVCGDAGRHLLYPRTKAPGFAFDAVTALLSYLWFWITILAESRESSQPASGLPFCDQHEHYWRRRGWIIVGGPVITIATVILYASRVKAGVVPYTETDWTFFVIVGWILALLYLMLGSVRPTGGDARTLVLSGAHRDFVAAVEREQSGY